MTIIVPSIMVSRIIRHISYVCGGMPDVRMGRDTCHMHRASVRGRKFFHSKCISWS